MMDYSKRLSSTYFSLQEIFKQNDKNEVLDIVYDPNKLDNMSTILDILDSLREEFGKPIYINSFYRDAYHNERVGGVNKSNHTIGAAVDITADDYSSLYHFILHTNKIGWRILPYSKRKFLHLELLKPKNHE